MFIIFIIMKIKNCFFLLFFFLSLSSCYGVENRLSTKEMAAELRSPNSFNKHIVAHRGRGCGAPDNSLLAMERTVKAGVPFIEVDLHCSKDGVIYLSHSGFLSSATSSKGKISLLNSEELKNIRLKKGGVFPRFSDAYALTKGKAILILDIKDCNVDIAGKWIAQNGSFDDVVFLVNSLPKVSAAARLKSQYPQMMVLIPIHSKEEINLLETFYKIHPDIVEIHPPNEEIIPWLHQRGIKVYGKSNWKEKLFFPFNSLMTKQVFDSQLDLILTDRPAIFLRHLSKHKA